MAELKLNGAVVGPVTIIPAGQSIEALREVQGDDGHDQVYFEDRNRLYVATGDNLNIRTFSRNLLLLDGRRVTLIETNDEIEGARDLKRQALRSLPPFRSPVTVGALSLGAVGTALALGARRPQVLLKTGLVAAGTLAVAGIAWSYFSAKYPTAVPGWMRGQ